MQTIAAELAQAFPDVRFRDQDTADGIATAWLERSRLRDALKFLKHRAEKPCAMLYDLSAIDERVRRHRDGQPAADFTVFYHLLSTKSNEDIRLKVPLGEQDIVVPTVADIYPNANWYEREAWDMFGIEFDGHPHLTRLIMPPTWEGHPLRKDHPARGTELGRYELDDAGEDREQQALRFRPEDWGMKRSHDGTDFMFLNIGPNHPSAHGVFRVVVQLDGEEIVDAVPDIGYHHRAAEKMGERQSWHTFIPYTYRFDYLCVFMNNLPYFMALEKLACI